MTCAELLVRVAIAACTAPLVRRRASSCRARLTPPGSEAPPSRPRDGMTGRPGYARPGAVKFARPGGWLRRRRLGVPSREGGLEGDVTGGRRDGGVSARGDPALAPPRMRATAHLTRCQATSAPPGRATTPPGRAAITFRGPVSGYRVELQSQYRAIGHIATGPSCKTPENDVWRARP